MLQTIIYMMILLSSILFMQINHPLSMGLMLLIQTMLICLATGQLAKSFWFSYMLFIVFLGGMLVLFIYVTSLASNEMFSMSIKSLMIYAIIIMFICLIMFIYDPLMNMVMIPNNEMNELMDTNSILEENMLTLNKIYNFPTNLVTLLLINYLLITLIAIVKITNIFYGPIRQMN